MLKHAQIASAFADERTSDVIQLIADYQRAGKAMIQRYAASAFEWRDLTPLQIESGLQELEA